jgi:hypothetical protein
MSGNRAFAVGFGAPPISTRFVKGQSGNPRGRPKGSVKQAPYQNVLGQMVMVRDGDQIRQMSAAQAFLLHITRKGLEGEGAAARAALKVIEEARASLALGAPSDLPTPIMSLVAPGSVNMALLSLHMAAKHDRLRPTARIVLQPWLVETALARMNVKQLSLDEQKTVWEATRTPWKVKWPSWWAYYKSRS